LDQNRHPTGGSFVKQNKIDFGIDIWTAAKEKYLSTIDSNVQDETSQKQNKTDEDLFLYNNFK
jgi:hypothetical protein